MIDYAKLALKELALLEPNPEVENSDSALPKLPEPIPPISEGEIVDILMGDDCGLTYSLYKDEAIKLAKAIFNLINKDQ
jgi:hypothetical protein